MLELFPSITRCSPTLRDRLARPTEFYVAIHFLQLLDILMMLKSLLFERGSIESITAFPPDYGL